MKNLDIKAAPEQWSAHVAGCAACRRFDRTQHATLALVCVIGASLIKDVLAMEAKPILAKQRRAQNEVFKNHMGEHYTTKKKALAAMRFKE